MARDLEVARSYNGTPWLVPMKASFGLTPGGLPLKVAAELRNLEEP